MSLDAALSSARARTWDDVLSALLAGFRETRNPRVAELVVRVSELAEKGLPAIAGKNLDARRDAAIALIEKGEPRDLPRVLRLLRELRMAQAKQVVEALADVPPDPRFLAAVLPLLRDPPFSSSTSMPFWRALLAVVDAQGDPRARPALEALDFAWLPDWSAEQFRTACRRLGGKKKKEVTSRALGPEEEAICAAIEAALGNTQKDGTALLKAIHADAKDDAARAVWADWLQERDDPRGKFVALQLEAEKRYPSEEERKALRSMLEKHGDEWLGDLAGVIDLENARFTRGFLSHVEVRTDELPRIVASEHAPTIEWLYVNSREEFRAELLRDPRLSALQFVGGIEPHIFDAIVAAGPYPFTGLGLDLYDAIPGREDAWTDAQRALMRRAYGLRASFPALTTLAVRAWYKKPDTLDELFASPLCEGLSALHLSGAGGAATWLGRRGKLPQGLELLEISFDFGFHDWTTELRRNDEGELGRVVATLRPKRKEFSGGKLEELATVLDEMPTDVLTELEVRAEGVRVAKPALDAIAEAARRHVKLRRLDLPGRPAVTLTKAPDARTAKDRARDAIVAETKQRLDAIAAMLGRPLAIAEASTPESLERLQQLLPEKTFDARSTELALALLGLPIPPSPDWPYRRAREALDRAALTVLAKGRCPEPFRRLLPLVPPVTTDALAKVLGHDHSLIGEGELAAFLDWFETLAVNGGASDLYYVVNDMLEKRDTPAVRADIEQRLEGRKLNRFYRWSYENFLQRA